MAKSSAKAVMTPEAILSFPALFVAREYEGQEKFQATFVFPPGSDIKELRSAATAVAKEKFGDKLGEMIQQGKFRNPFLNGKDHGYEDGSIVVRTSSKKDSKPGVVDRDGKTVITDPSVMYSGCKVRATIRPFAYDTKGNKGVSFGLQNVQRLGEGKRLDGRKAVTDEFDAVEGAIGEMAGEEL